MPTRRGIAKRILTTTILLSVVCILAITSSNLFQSAAASTDPKPDLIVQSIALSPINPVVGDTVTITVTIKNQGTLEAGSSHIACYVDDNYLTSEYIGLIAAGTSKSSTFSWKAQAGSHTIKAVADYNNQVSESNESNNPKTYTFTTLAPDLTIQSISWTPEEPSRGDSITFSIVIKNQGTSQSKSSRVNFYIDGTSRGYQDAYSINPGASVIRTYTWIATAGQHAIKAAIDEENNIMEGDETNNERTVTFTTLSPDLIVQDITWSPENPSKKDNVTFTAVIKNQGSGRSDACNVAYYIDETFLSTGLVDPIEAGDSVNMTFNWAILADSYDIKVIIDYYKKVAESDENNNENSVIFSPLAPDLIVQKVDWSPKNAAAGDIVTFTVIIKNQGVGKAGISRTACYISGQHNSYLDIPEINADSEVTKTFEWKAVVGSHALSVVADYNDKLSESNEDNNKETATIPIIPPDLVISKIAWSPEKPTTGDTVTFTVTVTNEGGGVAERFRVAYYIDDEFLTTGYVDKVESDASANCTFTWKVQNGSHTFKAIADYNTMITESNENNNENAVIISPIMPDVTIDNISWTPVNLSAGDRVTFNAAIKNQGDSISSSFRIAYYIDGSMVGYQDVGQMDVGATVMMNFPWTALDGHHTIEIAADSNNQVAESDETNNVKKVNLPPPDLIIQDITCSPEVATVGDKVTFTVYMKNQGTGPADNSKLAYYVNGTYIESQSVSEIAPGVIAKATFDWIAEAGTNTIKIVTDPENRVTETDETNNAKSVDFSTLTPDLVIKDISWSMVNPLISDDVTVTITIMNQGSDKTGNSRIKCYLDKSSAGSQDIQGIIPGGTVTKTIVLTVKDGSHTVKVVADPDNKVIEIDETNNEKVITFSTIAPDLIIKDISWWPTEALVGDPITFTVKIKNQGRYAALNPRIDFQIDGSSLGQHDLGEIDAGVTVTREFTWSAEEGPHEIHAFIDLEEMILESNESNNTEYQTFSLPAIAEPAKRSAQANSQEGGILEDFWWLLLLVAVAFGGIAFFVAMKSNKKWS